MFPSEVAKMMECYKTLSDETTSSIKTGIL